jgi:hypothetical protein
MSDDARLTPHDYQSALDAQMACNLSGIVHSFSSVMTRIWAEARALGKGTGWVNAHPIARLYAEQIAHLSGAGITSHSDSYTKAHDTCTREAACAERKSIVV